MSGNEATHISPTSIAISPTHRCTAACAGCAFGSHPWVVGGLSLREIKTAIREATNFPTIKLVAFTGGEPTLIGEDLIRAIEYASALGFATRVVSNAYWATSEKRAERFVKHLVDAGLTEINFSTGDEHAKFVPLENVLRATAVSLRLGLDVAVMLESRMGNKITMNTLLNHPLGKDIFSGPAKDRVLLSPSPWINVEHIEDENGSYPHDENDLLNRNTLVGKTGCSSALSDIALLPTGDLYACCGLTIQKMPEWRMGKLGEGDLVEMYRNTAYDFLKIWIATDGPERILAWAADKDPGIKWENRFSHSCEVCYYLYHDPRVKRVIREHFHSVKADVLARFAVTKEYLLHQEGSGNDEQPACSD